MTERQFRELEAAYFLASKDFAAVDDLNAAIRSLEENGAVLLTSQACRGVRILAAPEVGRPDTWAGTTIIDGYLNELIRASAKGRLELKRKAVLSQIGALTLPKAGPVEAG